MTETPQKLDGACLCGAVRVRLTQPERGVEACHCTMCRHWGGGPLLSLHGVTAPRFEGEQQIARYSSSDWAERGFCRACGTHLFFYYRPEQTYSFAAGLFDLPEGFALTEEIFVDEKPGYYDFAGDADRLTGAEAMAKHGAAVSDRD